MTSEKAYESVWTHLMDLPFTQGYIDANGIRTRYVNAGPKGAPKVIMLHGVGGSWENCFANIPAHAQEFDVYAFDLVGHGYSDKPDRPMTIDGYVEHVKDTMNALGIESAAFVGVSLGSWVSTKMAVKYPERVEKVTMISGWGREVGRPDLTSPEKREAYDRVAKARLEAARNPTWKLMEQIFAGLIADPDQWLPDLFGLRIKIYSQPGMDRAWQNITKGMEQAWIDGTVSDEEARGIKCPFLIIASVDSKDAFLECSYQYQKLIPNVKVVDMPKTSHWAQWEQLDAFNKANLEFLRG